MSTVPIPPILSLLIGHIAAAVPRRARITFTELLIGAAATRGGHVTDAILAEAALGGWAVAQLDHGLLGPRTTGCCSAGAGHGSPSGRPC